MSLSRRDFLKVTSASLATAFIRPGPEDDPSIYELEKDTPLVYFPETGHHLSGAFLNYYRYHQNGLFLGPPVTEKLRLKDDRLVQYFTNVRLEQRPNRKVAISSLAKNYINNEEYDPHAPPLNQEFYDKFGGAAFFGPILSQPQFNGLYTYQYTTNFVLLEKPVEPSPTFARSYAIYRANREKYPRLLWPGEITAAPLGLNTAQLLNLDTAPITPDTASVTPSFFAPQRRLVVNISAQFLTAYEGDLSVYRTSVSSGRYGFDTPYGDFTIRQKYDQWRYISPFPQRIWYDLSYVPWNMLIEPNAGVFLHGAYWHSDWGRRHSSGCINLNLDDAAWLYYWTDIGTPVQVVP